MARKEGIEVYAGISDKKKDIELFLAIGVDGIFTDDVFATKKILRELSGS